MAGPSHPALKFHQHQLIGAIDQGQVVDCAVALAAMMQRKMETVAAEATDLGITADDHIKVGPEPGDAAAQFGPAHHHSRGSQD